MTFFSKTKVFFLKFAHCTNVGIDTQRNIGTACSSRSVDRALTHYAVKNETTQAEAISCAIKNKKLLVLMIDDYATMHSHRRPTALATNNVLNMATIIIKIYPQLEVIQVKNLELVHTPQVFNMFRTSNVTSCTNFFIMHAGDDNTFCRSFDGKKETRGTRLWGINRNPNLEEV